MNDNERLVKCEESTKNAHKRLDDQNKKINELEKVYVALTKVDAKLDNVIEDVTDLKTSVNTFKEKPAKSWESLKNTIITRCCYGYTGFFISKIWFVRKVN